MYGQEDHCAELALYLTGPESFTSTAVARHAQLQTGAVAAVSAGAGGSGKYNKQPSTFACEPLSFLTDVMPTRLVGLSLTDGL